MNSFKDWTIEDAKKHNERIAQNRGKISSPKPEPVVRHAPVVPAKRKAAYTGRVSISVTSFRRRLCDPDNLCPKYFIDGLRYAGLISNDTPECISLRVDQKKVRTEEEERTEILIVPL